MRLDETSIWREAIAAIRWLRWFPEENANSCPNDEHHFDANGFKPKVLGNLLYKP